MRDCADDCVNRDGGYFDEKTWTCTTFKVLSSVCLSVYFDGEWKLNSEGNWWKKGVGSDHKCSAWVCLSIRFYGVIYTVEIRNEQLFPF